MSPSIFQINIKPDTPGEVGLPKMPIESTIVTEWGLEGDYNRFREKEKENDRDMAVMIISTDILDALNNEGWPVKPGDLGENITLANIDYASMAPGQKYKLGAIELEISIICNPCSNLYKLSYVGEEKGPQFIKTLMNRRGWYARVLKTGQISAGDTVSLLYI